MNLFYVFLLMWMWKIVSVAQDVDSSGLKFSKEPPNRVDFINTKGKQVECVATGSPKPVTNWTLIDGSPVTTISGLREVSSSSGNLVFHSFRPENFRPDVHAAVYRCIATSYVGTIYSRDINVRGVVLQNHDVQVFDSYSIEGNSAVLKCHIPTVLSEFLKVIAWIKNDNLLIQPSIEESAHDKYLLMPTGELHIRNVSLGESSSRYKCKMVNRLTGDTQISSTAGQLFVTDSRGNVSPRISDSAPSVSSVVGQIAVLACVAQGNPIPTLKWFKRSFGNQRLPIDNNNRYVHTQSSLLIKNARAEDAGAYVCEVSNEVGNEQFDVVLSVIESISVNLSPSVRMANANDRVVFDCEVTGQPLASVSWLHNGMPLFKTTGKELTIDSVQMSDRGMYQCMAKNNQDMVQAAAELRLSEILPLLEEVFDESTIKPGSRVTVKCAASGIPLPTISWNIDGIVLKDDAHIRITSSTDKAGRIIGNLELEDAVVENGGLYSCVAVNSAGKKIHSKRINVYGSLGSRTIPERLVVARESALLSCPLYGYPLPTISWEKAGVKLPVDYRQNLMENGSLLIEDVDRKTNSGSYKCFVSNISGQNVEAKIDVVVMVPPKIVPFEFQDELLREGMRARLQCVVSEGDLPLTMTWLKDGKPLSPELGVLVRVLDEFSSILTISSITPDHNGKYVCVAFNRAATVTHSAELSVNVPPKIVPFSFQDDQLVEGQLARVSCVVSRGDLPLKLLWEKDGKGISSTREMGIQIRSFDEHSSIMSIASVSPEHNGQYTCIASNGAGSARHSAELTVQVPSRWIIEPHSASVYKGESIMLHCQAGGFPKPILSWSYAADIRKLTIRKDLRTDGSINLFSNGSLLINNMSPLNEGFYYCKAINGIGRDLISRVEVKILAPPVFKGMDSKVNSTVGNSVKLECLVQGDFPIKVHWLKESEMISDSQAKYKIQTTNLSSEISSILTITKVSREDNGNFICVAENSHGKNQSTINAVVTEKPDPPTEFKTSAVGSQYVELVWKLQYNGNSPIKRYTIQYKESQNSWDESVTMETVNGEPKNSVVTHLHPATSYVFRIFSENNIGRSAASQLLRVTTNEDVPSGPPLNVQVESVNTETIKVLWKAPEEKLWNGKILGFYVGYKEVDTEDPYLYKTLLTPVPNADDLAIQIGGLKQFTKYAVTVQAYNGQGKGPKSEPVIIMTSEGAPSLAPTDIRCTTLTSQSIHVTWTAPPSDSINGILRGYKVLYKPASDWFEDMAENYNFTFPTSLTMYGLEKFSNYSIQVLAMTKTAEGPRSIAIFCKTLDDVPGSPVDIKAIAMTDDSVIVAWKPPDHPNGVIRLYSVYWKAEGNAKDAGAHTVPVRENSYEVTGLKKGRRYDFYVTASTMAGEGLPSRMVTQHPSGPTVAAKIVSFEDKVMTPWQSNIEIPCQAVGIPEPQRKWTFKGRILDSNEKYKVSDGTLSIRNILEEDAGDYMCHVQNDYGEDTITYTILVLAPPSAPIINVASVTSNSIEINWKTPSSKMSRIKGYNLHVRRDSSESLKEVTLGADVRSYKLNNLECGIRHEIHMAAFNKIGVGALSELLVVSTNGSVPISPSKTDLIEESSNSISLYLNTWKNNGCPVLHFVVEYAPKSSNEWTVVSNTVKPEQRRLIIPNLKPGTWYGLRMTAHNSAGLTVAQYDFSTLTSSGATISPDLQNDSTGVQLDSLWTYLNIYIIIPVGVTLVILFVILGVACMCLSKSHSKKGHSRNSKGKRLSANAAEMKRGDSSESFAYMQRGNVHRSDKKSKHDEIAPYATLNLANQRTPNHGSMAGRSDPPVPPPLPPPRMEYSHRGSHGFNQQPFFCPGQSNFHHGHGGGTTETTFIFPNIDDPGLRFPPQYPHEAMKAACFKH